MKRLITFATCLLLPASAAAAAQDVVVPAPRPIMIARPAPAARPTPIARPAAVARPAAAPLPVIAPARTTADVQGAIDAALQAQDAGSLDAIRSAEKALLSAQVEGSGEAVERALGQVELAREAAARAMADALEMGEARRQVLVEKRLTASGTARENADAAREFAARANEMAARGLLSAQDEAQARADVAAQRAELVQQTRVDASRDMDVARVELNVERLRQQAEEMRLKFSEDAVLSMQGPTIVSGKQVVYSSNDGSPYSSGLSALQQRQYDRAITAFDRVVAQKAPRVDGALYWKAFAQFKLGRTEDAMAAITQLRRDFPQTRYLNDARVLEVEVRKMGGQPVNLDDLAANEEIKILAIQAMQRTDPDRAIPLLEGVLNAANSLAVKKQAIYVLALSEDPRAHQIMLKYAKGDGNPDLQAETIRYLASRRDRQTTGTELKEIYESSQDPMVRRAVIDAFSSAGDKGSLMGIMNGTGNSLDVRRSALSGLTTLAAPGELWSLYQKETDRDLRSQIVGLLGTMGAVDQLSQAAKTDKEPAVRQRAIRSLGNQKPERTGTILTELYAADQDAADRRAIVSALANQSNADGMVAIARKETSLDLKREIVRRLTEMAPKSKAAADYLMDIINK